MTMWLTGSSSNNAVGYEKNQHKHLGWWRRQEAKDCHTLISLHNNARCGLLWTHRHDQPQTVRTALISPDLTRLQSLPPIWNVPSRVQLVGSGVWQTQPKKQVIIFRSPHGVYTLLWLTVTHRWEEHGVHQSCSSNISEELMAWHSPLYKSFIS